MPRRWWRLHHQHRPLGETQIQGRRGWIRWQRVEIWQLMRPAALASRSQIRRRRGQIRWRGTGSGGCRGRRSVGGARSALKLRRRGWPGYLARRSARGADSPASRRAVRPLGRRRCRPHARAPCTMGSVAACCCCCRPGRGDGRGRRRPAVLDLVSAARDLQAPRGTVARRPPSSWSSTASWHRPKKRTAQSPPRCHAVFTPGREPLARRGQGSAHRHVRVGAVQGRRARRPSPRVAAPPPRVNEAELVRHHQAQGRVGARRRSAGGPDR